MSDEDYMPVSERDRDGDVMVDAGISSAAWDAVTRLWRSHAIADDVMRDLAEELRAAWSHPLTSSEPMPGAAALNRYDRLTGGNDA